MRTTLFTVLLEIKSLRIEVDLRYYTHLVLVMVIVKLFPLVNLSVLIKHLTEVSTSGIPIPSTIPLQDLVILKFTCLFGQRIWNWKTRSHFFFTMSKKGMGTSFCIS